jgi:hypothetical protein
MYVVLCRQTFSFMADFSPAADCKHHQQRTAIITSNELQTPPATTPTPQAASWISRVLTACYFFSTHLFTPLQSSNSHD